MKTNEVTMVHPRQIVSKGLKGCSSTRTVTTFAQKHKVPCVWWSPTRNQKVLLVDWPQFRSTWKDVRNTKCTTTGNNPTTSRYTAKYGPTRFSTGHTSTAKATSRFTTGNATSSTKTRNKPKVATSNFSKTTNRNARPAAARTYTKRTRRVA